MNILNHKLLAVNTKEPLLISRVDNIWANRCYYTPAWDSFTSPEGKHFQHMDIRLVVTSGNRQAKMVVGLLFEVTLDSEHKEIAEDADTSCEIIHLAMKTAAELFASEAGGTSFDGIRPLVQSPDVLQREMSLQGYAKEE